jgi:hypothetical protein
MSESSSESLTEDDGDDHDEYAGWEDPQLGARGYQYEPDEPVQAAASGDVEEDRSSSSDDDVGLTDWRMHTIEWYVCALHVRCVCRMRVASWPASVSCLFMNHVVRGVY